MNTKVLIWRRITDIYTHYDNLVPQGEWQETWDALFWRFLDVHREVFLKNPRLGMLVKTYDKWPDEKKLALRIKSEKFLANSH